VLVPLNTLPARYPEFDRNRKTIVHCKSGMRSLRACAFLREQGFTNVLNVTGGIDSWR